MTPPRSLLAVLALALAAAAPVVLAQNVPPPPTSVPQGDAADPPGRVGRLADLNGTVWQFSPETGEWISASRNRVLTTGDRVATDANGRAELRVGSTVMRLDGGSEIEFTRLDDERIDVQVHTGALGVRVRNREALNDIAVATNEGRFVFQRTGRYRIDRQDETSYITVLSGQALYEGPRSALGVNAGQRAEFWIDGAGVAQYALGDPQRDDFAAWTAERDRADDRSASTRYVSPEMTGVEELDRHGRWERSEEYGPLWVPYRVAPGWAPYSTGRWAWVAPWGWTWVDEAPWGFAPFHYGRWVHVRGTWCWAPGTYVARPVWAPALVAWVGGPGVSVSVRVGGPPVGWFPLAPREVYVPHYRHSPVYIRNVNVTHVTNVTVIDRASRPGRPEDPTDLRYRKFPNAVTVVPAEVVTSRQPVAPAAAQLRERGVVREVVERPSRAPVTWAPPVTSPPVAAVAPVTPPPGRVLPPSRGVRDPTEARGDDARRDRVVAPPPMVERGDDSRRVRVSPTPAEPARDAAPQPQQPSRRVVMPETRPMPTPPPNAVVVPPPAARPAPPAVAAVPAPPAAPAAKPVESLPSRVRHMPQPQQPAAPAVAAPPVAPPVVRAQPEPSRERVPGQRPNAGDNDGDRGERRQPHNPRERER